MPALPSRRASTAARLAATVALGLSAAPLGLLTESVAQARERVHDRIVREREAAHEALVPLPTAVQEAAQSAPAPSPVTQTKDAAPRPSEVLPQVSERRERRQRESPRQRLHRARHPGSGVPAPVSPGVEAAEGATTEAGEAAAQTLSGLSAASGARHRRPGAGHGGHGKGGGHGKHKGSGGEEHPSGETGGGSTTSGAGTAASTQPATPPAPVGTPSLSAPSASAPAVSAANAPSASLAPQLAAFATQPTSRASDRGAKVGHAPRGSVAAFEATLATPAGGAGATAAVGATPTADAHPAAARTQPTTHGSSNPLEGIGRHIPLPIPVPAWVKTVIVALFLLAIWLSARAYIEGARARRLERQRAGLLRDMGAMQAALIPEVPRELGGLDVSVAYRPAEGPAAGGDFYDVFEPRPGVVAVMLGDVSGHGHEALTHAALTRYTLRAYMQAGLEPRTALALAGRVLKDPSGARYATVALGVYDAGEGTLTYALAGHPPPMIVGEGELKPITACSSPPVGWGMPTGRRQTTISLPEGAEACFFSDGLIEARHEGQLLGREELRQIFLGLGTAPAAEDLLEAVRATADGTPDDMVACVLSPKAAPHEARVHVEELEVDASMLAQAGVRRFLRECAVPPAKMARALRLAAETASAAGSAGLRVSFEPGRISVSVSSPASAARRGAGRLHGTEVLPEAPELVGANQARALA
jgi:Stage II sporulation protein E (SpoIIE)